MAQITAELATGTQVTITKGRHTWRSDEPPASGGTDTGPTPYELLLGALAACTCITLHLYSRHKGIALASVSATYEYARVHADDCEDCEEPKKGFIDRVTSRVRIAGDLDKAQQQRLVQIVGRCPVHKTLEYGMNIDDRVEFT